MNFRVTCLFFFIFVCRANSWAQTNLPDRQEIPDLHNLNPVDSALLQLYKDSFQTDLMDILDFLNGPEIKKRDTTVYNMDRSSHAEVSLGFVSRNLVYGRDMGISGPGFFPSTTYYHKYGFFVGLTLAFYTNQSIATATPVPATVPYAGFQRTFFRRWFLGVAYSRTFLGYGSVESRNMLVNDFSFSTSVDLWKRLILGFSAYIDWSSLNLPRKVLPGFEKRSYEVPVSLRKEFLIYHCLGAKVFTITPILTAYFATDNFAFIRQRAVAEETGGTLAVYTPNVDHFFGFADIEPSLHIDWRIRNVEIYVLPALAIPFNVFDYQTSSRVTNPHMYEFYVQAGVKYLFHLNKVLKKK
jgi:hypothetical protein